jgi:hypothetical protein
MSEPILDGAQPLPIPSSGVSVDDENVTKLHTQNNVNNFDLKEERHVMKHILSITSCTCTLRYFMQEMTNGGK